MRNTKSRIVWTKTLVIALFVGLLTSVSSISPANAASVNVAGLTLNFDNTATTGNSQVVTGTGKNLNDIILYKKVVTVSGLAVDAVVTTKALTTISIGTYDTPGSASSSKTAFQVDATTNGTVSGATGGSAQFNIAFYEAGTYTKPGSGISVVLQNATVSSIDLDSSGSGDLQFTDFSGFQKYTLTSDTHLTPTSISATPNRVHFLTNNNANSASIPQDQATVVYTSLSSIDITVGNIKAGLGYYGIIFGPAAWGTATPVTKNNSFNTPPTSTDVSLNVANSASTVLTRANFGTYADVDNNPFYSISVTSLPSQGTLEFNDGTGWKPVALNTEILTSDIDLGKLRYTATNTTSFFNFKVGDGLAFSNTANKLTFVISNSSQTLSLTNPGAKVLSVGTVTMTTSATSGLIPVLTSLTPGICTVSGTTVTLLAVGNCTIAANQPGDATYAAAPQVTVTFPVTSTALTAQTITYTNPGPQLLSTGQYNLPTDHKTASSGLAVTYTSYTPSVCTINTSPPDPWKIVFLTTGYCDVKATQDGNLNFSPASPVEWIFPISVPSLLTLTYDPRGGTGAPSPSTFTSGTTTTTSTVAPTKTGYNFFKWTTNADGSGAAYDTNTTTAVLNTDTTIYAQWTAKTWTVTYHLGSGVSPTTPAGTVPTVQSFTSGNSVTILNYDANTPVVSLSGYNFSSWNTNDSGTATTYVAGASYSVFANLDLYPVWTAAAKKSITYDANGGLGTTPTSQQFTPTTETPTVQAATGLSRIGYTFVSWNTNSGGTGTTYATADKYLGVVDVTLFAQWTANNYELTYDPNGGTGTAPSRATYTVNTFPTIAATTLNRAGYRFDGWNTKRDGSGEDYFVTDTYTVVPAAPALTSTIYAQWLLNSYTVSFNSNGATGGTLPSTSTFTVAAGATIPGNTGTLVRTGYKFDGWNTAPDGSGITYLLNDRYAYPIDLILYANWSFIDYAIVYEKNGGTGTPPLQQIFNVQSGATISDIKNYVDPTINDLTRSGYTFSNWATNADGTGTSYNTGDTYTVTADLTLYANWTANSYTLSYNHNTLGTGSMSDQPFTVISATHISSNTFTPNAGYRFVGWNTTSGGTGTSYADTSIYSTPGNQVLYAMWEETAKSSVIYDLNGGSGTSPTTQKVTSGTSVTVSSNGLFSRAGYTFNGWNTAADGSGTNRAANSSLTVSSDITLYAKWTANSYTLSYNKNGGTGSIPSNQSFTVIAGATVGTGSLTKTGYTFDGWWNSASGGTGSTTLKVGDVYSDPADLTLYALWTPIDYTITYDANGGLGDTPENQVFNVENGATIASGTDALFRVGYTFNGWWNTAANGLGTESYAAGDSYNKAADITLYAIWTPINYSVVYDKNGGSGTNPIKQDFNMSSSGATINDGAALTLPGYSFDGWNTSADGTGTDFTGGDIYQDTFNLTLYAMWNPIEYKLVYDANGGSGTLPADQPFTVETGVTITDATSTITRTGYTFYGWWNNASDGAGTKSFVPGDVYNEPANITLYAIWVPIGQYAILYDANGGSGTAPGTDFFTTLSEKTVAAAPAGMVRTGYVFAGWYSAKTGGTNYVVGAHPTSLANLELFAQWTPNAYVIKYDGNSNSGGTKPADGSYTSGSTKYVIQANSGNLARSGYAFIGWNTSANGTGDAFLGGDTFTVTVSTAATTTLYAQWDPIEYTVFYDNNGADGGTVPSDTVFTLDAPATISTTTLTLAGATFKSWNTAANGSGTKYLPSATYATASDLLLYAIFTTDTGGGGGGGGGGGSPEPTPTPTPTPVPSPTPTPTPVPTATPTPTPTPGNKVTITGSITTHAAPKKIVPNQIVKVIQEIKIEEPAGTTINYVLVNGKKAAATISTTGKIELSQLVGPKDKIVVVELVNGAEVQVPIQEKNEPISLANVNFDTDSYGLTAKAKKILDKVAAVVLAHGFTVIDLIGHTDTDGANSGYDNQALSHNRAVQSRAYLLKKIAGHKIKIKIEAKAQVEPVASNSTPTGRAANRRVEIAVH